MNTMLKNVMLACLINAFFSQVAFSHELPKTSPENVGFSSERLKRIDTMMEEHINRGELSGAVVLIARHGKIAYHRSFGYMDYENKKAMTKDAIFPIASMTKAITSVAMLTLYEEGHFLLNDPVSKFIPEFKDMKVIVEENGSSTTISVKREISIRDLARHTAGFVYSGGRSAVDDMYRAAGFRDWDKTLKEFATKIAAIPLAYQPGEKWEYSYSSDVLGYLIEVISGQKLDKFMKDRIFVPLNMKDTEFYIPEDKLSRFPNFYRFKEGKLQLRNTSFFKKRPLAISGGGGWWGSYGGAVTTAADFASFLQMLLNYGKLGDNRILSRKSVELMAANHIKGIKGREPGAGYGLGVGVTTDIGSSGELCSAGEIYWAGAPYNTCFWCDYKEDMFGILFTTTAPFRHLDLMGRYKVLALQAIDD